MIGLAGHDAGYTQLVWLVASVLGAAVLVALVLVYRRARARHELEEAERLIEEAFAEPISDRAQTRSQTRPHLSGAGHDGSVA